MRNAKLTLSCVIAASRWRECFSEQHYFATLLSFKGFENETACDASLTNSGGDDTKPHMFPLEAITADGCALFYIPTKLEKEYVTASEWPEGP